MLLDRLSAWHGTNWDLVPSTSSCGSLGFPAKGRPPRGGGLFRRFGRRVTIANEGTMTITARKIPSALAVLLLGTLLAGQEKPFPVISTVDEPTIAGHPVQLDEHGKLLPWPMPDNVG